MKKIMFVCTGNTCRSPMAEYILKDFIKKAQIEDIKVTSAGVMANEEDKISQNASVALKKLGITVRRFKPKRPTEDLCRKQNAVICMSANHKKYFIGFNNVYTIDELTGLGEIPDPYGKDQTAYDQCASKLQYACKIIFDVLLENDG